MTFIFLILSDWSPPGRFVYPWYIGATFLQVKKLFWLHAIADSADPLGWVILTSHHFLYKELGPLDHFVAIASHIIPSISVFVYTNVDKIDHSTNLKPIFNCSYSRTDIFQIFQMWWLYYKTINISTNFTPVSNNSTLQPEDLLKSGASRVNFGFNSLSWNQIR